MPSYKLPTDEEVKSILSMITQNCDVTGCETTDYTFAAEFANAEGAVVSLCLSDLPLSAAMGAALSMIPPAAAEEMVADGELTEMAEANLYEVMNMFSTLFMSDRTPHLKLTRVTRATECESVAASADFEISNYQVDVGAYGRGNVSFRTT